MTALIYRFALGLIILWYGAKYFFRMLDWVGDHIITTERIERGYVAILDAWDWLDTRITALLTRTFTRKNSR